MTTKTIKPGELIGWEEVEREFDDRFGPKQEDIKVGSNSNHTYGTFKSFLHSKLFAQQEKTEKMVLEGVRGMVGNSPTIYIGNHPMIVKDGQYCFRDDLLSKLSEMEEEI